MKNLSSYAAALLLLGSLSAHAAPATYLVTITNGGAMPFSPGLLYLNDGESAVSRIGQAPSAGLTQLCQMGDPSLLKQELATNTKIKSVVETGGMLFPGESRSFEVVADQPATQSLHFQSMYGKSKDVCAIASVGTAALRSLRLHVSSELISKDRVIATGSFLDPIVPMGVVDACATAADAITCLRGLAATNPTPKVKEFPGYLPSVLNQLEGKFGAEQVLALQIPAAGAAEIRIRLKH